MKLATWELLNWFLEGGSRTTKRQKPLCPRILQDHQGSGWSGERERGVRGGSTSKPLKTVFFSGNVTGGSHLKPARLELEVPGKDSGCSCFPKMVSGAEVGHGLGH